MLVVSSQLGSGGLNIHKSTPTKLLLHNQQYSSFSLSFFRLEEEETLFMYILFKGVSKPPLISDDAHAPLSVFNLLLQRFSNK